MHDISCRIFCSSPKYLSSHQIRFKSRGKRDCRVWLCVHIHKSHCACVCVHGLRSQPNAHGNNPFPSREVGHVWLVTLHHDAYCFTSRHPLSPLTLSISSLLFLGCCFFYSRPDWTLSWLFPILSVPAPPFIFCLSAPLKGMK